MMPCKYIARYFNNIHQQDNLIMKNGRLMHIKHPLSILLFLLLFSPFLSAQQVNTLKGKRVLVFSKTMGFRHTSIPAGIKAIKELGKQNDFQVDATENAADFTEKNLKKYHQVIFLSTTGNVLNNVQQIVFERFIQAGGTYVGIHAAADTEYDWAWYGKLVGGYFSSHPGNPNVQEGKMIVVDKNHPSTSFMADSFMRKDEFYDFKNFDPSVKVLILVDEKSYKEGKMGNYHPMAWCKEYDGGRAFYTNWGHTDESFSDPVVLKHILGGMTWAASGPDIDFSKPLRSQYPPEENRFIRTVLDEKLNEPTELVVTEGGKILFAERKGKLKMFDPKKGKTKVVAQIPVYSEQEYGLMGLNIDPDYNKNKWVYLYYSSPRGNVDTTQHLSRFVYDDVNDSLIMSSEKIIMRIPVKRTDCCHTGGSIEWDAAGNLYLSTGDDVNPFASDGYGPMDERAGRQGWDGRYTSSNTNDYRGKILRIKPLNDGTYAIPEGNLFPKGMEKTLPEIYVMGNRNPYRISVDKHTGFLYWGEVGPDAGENSKKWGPRGHDEVNQARKAGYFGWPLFVADNRAYNGRLFADSTFVGKPFDPQKPINNSPHNTGLTELPPAQKAFIYYPYADSPEFGAVVGKGGRNAMAGPVYYSDDFKDVEKRFPDYFNGKFFAYDWMRDWVNLVTMNAAGDFVEMERFMPKTKFSHPMDMQFGRDGALYMLEYGQNWFAQNSDARLIKIEYNAGNRTPVAVATASKTAGAAPLTVNFSSEGSVDYDNDPLSITWVSDAKKAKKSKTSMTSFTYKKAGVYHPKLTVKDGNGNVATQTLEIKVGNEPPKVEMVIKGNKSFYWNGKPIAYEVKVLDKEDGSLASNGIKSEEVRVSIDHLQGFDKTVIAQGHQQNLRVANGLRLIELSDCKSCHSQTEKSVGPSYLAVAQKYKKERDPESFLSERILKGASGIWGENAMAAHPQLTQDEAKEMVRYILSLADEKQKSKPVSDDNFVPNDKKKAGTYVFSASYADKGANGVGSQSGFQTIILRSAKFKAASFDANKDAAKMSIDERGDFVMSSTNGSFIAFNDLDFTDLSSLTVYASGREGATVGGTIEVRLDKPDGELLGSATIKNGPPTPYKMPFNKKQADNHTLFLVFINPNAGGKPLFALWDIEMD
jgi:cytochrome c